MSTRIASLSLVLLSLTASCAGKAEDTGRPGNIASTNPTDEDGDGIFEDNDCDDADPSVYPGAPELCDGIDNDCDDEIDEDAADAATFHADGDADGYGSPDIAVVACAQPEGFVEDATDCDDDDADVHPAAQEICNGVDDDCDDLVDDDDDGVDLTDAGTFFLDSDEDGYGDPDAGVLACTAPEGHRLNSDDCDDTRADVHPTAVEICNDIDDDCDDLIDDQDDGVDLSSAREWFGDADTDGYGDPATTALSCSVPSGYVEDGTDCDDTRDDVHPGATEVCDDDDVDEDCDGDSDDADADVDLGTGALFYPDEDRDGYGDSADAGTTACDDPSTAVDAYASDNSDCDDTRDDVNPAATEVCDDDDVDEDCSGAADDADPGVDPSTGTAWYPDADADGYGDAAAASTQACDDPSTTTDAFVVDATDCNDARDDVNPGATEVCDADDVDEDCNGSADDDDDGVVLITGTLWYPDDDSDGYGDATDGGTLYCDDPSAGAEVWLADDTDCDDADSRVNPGATELCDGIDTDCDGSTSEAGTVSFLDGSGTWTDVTTTFTGAPGSPVAGGLADDGTLYVCEGTWYWNLEVTAAAVDIVGLAGATGTVIDGDAAGTVIDVASGSTLGISGVTIQNGFAPSGAGIYVDGGALVAEDIAVRANVGDGYGFGAGIYVDGGSASITSSELSENTGYRGGGGFVDNAGYLELIECTVDGNETSTWGGGLEVLASAELYISDSVISNNTAGSYGGGIECNAGGVVTLVESEVSSNTATSANGGGLDLYACDLDIENTLVEDNAAGGSGGGMYVNTDADLIGDGVELASNSASNGGGIAVLGGIALTDSDLYTNTALDAGGGVWLDHSGELMTFTSVDFSANTPQSVWNEDASTGYTYGLGSSFGCSGTGCF